MNQLFRGGWRSMAPRGSEEGIYAKCAGIKAEGHSTGFLAAPSAAGINAGRRLPMDELRRCRVRCFGGDCVRGATCVTMHCAAADRHPQHRIPFTAPAGPFAFVRLDQTALVQYGFALRPTAQIRLSRAARR
jgi:hypothetical protein